MMKKYSSIFVDALHIITKKYTHIHKSKHFDIHVDYIKTTVIFRLIKIHVTF